MKKEIILSFIAGAVLVAVGYLGVVFFKSIQKINNHEVALAQVVDFLNKQIEASQAQQGIVTQSE